MALDTKPRVQPGFYPNACNICSVQAMTENSTHKKNSRQRILFLRLEQQVWIDCKHWFVVKTTCSSAVYKSAPQSSCRSADEIMRWTPYRCRSILLHLSAFIKSALQICLAGLCQHSCRSTFLHQSQPALHFLDLLCRSTPHAYVNFRAEKFLNQPRRTSLTYLLHPADPPRPTSSPDPKIFMVYIVPVVLSILPCQWVAWLAAPSARLLSSLTTRRCHMVVV